MTLFLLSELKDDVDRIEIIYIAEKKETFIMNELHISFDWLNCI